MSKLPPVYSPAEEKTNVWTHAAGAVIALAGVIGAFFIAPPSGVAGTAGYLVYGVSLVLMYLVLFHLVLYQYFFHKQQYPL